MIFWNLEEKIPPWRLLVRVYARAAPLLVPTLVVLLILGATLASWQPERIAALLLAVFAITTLSHHLLVDEVMGLEKAGP